MRRWYRCLFVSLLLIGIGLGVAPRAEWIDGPANIREKPNGKIIYQLNDKAVVGCHGLAKDGWYLIGVEAAIREEFLLNGRTIKPGSVLHDRSGNVIGQTVAAVDALEWEKVGLNAETDLVELTIDGYTHINNIKDESLFERVLERVLREKKVLTTDSFQTIIRAEVYGYNFYPLFEEHNGFVAIYVPEFSAGPFDNGIRDIFVFYHGKLAAVIYTKRKVNLPFLREKKLFDRGDYRLGYLIELSQKVAADMEEFYKIRLSNIN